MNIAFDAVAILGPMSKNRGIGNYALAQFREMIRRDTENHYFFFNIVEPFSLGDYPNLSEFYFDCGKDWELLRVADCAAYGALVQAFIQKNKIDVFYITSPFEDHVPVYREEWFAGAKTVATVYDIIPYVFQEHYFPNGLTDSKWYTDRLDTLQWMDELLVISQSVKDDLMQYLNFRGDNIHVIWGAPSEMFRELSVRPAEADTLRRKYGLKSRFIMCTGGDDERKNIAGLIEAYGKLPQTLTDRYGLVIVCKLQKASEERYAALAKRLGVGDKVAFTNFVPDEELVQLYNLASLVAFPSKYEGFGLPVVEAWACGTPVLTSDNSSLIQIAGDAAVTVNADDVEDIARGLKEALEDDALAALTKKGRERLHMFQWPVVADEAVRRINQLRPQRKTEPGARPKLACFTPLPPIESGIADYSVDVLCELSKEFDIDVFVDSGYRPECALPDRVGVFEHRAFPKKAREYEYVLYQMGNSLYHYYMYPYLRKYGGVLVLHDYNMHGVGQAIALHELHDNMRTYREYLLEDYPAEQVDRYLAGIRSGAAVDCGMELNGFVANYADRLIVHSDYSREKLLRKNIGRVVEAIPLYATITPLPKGAAAKEKMGISPDLTVLASVGHVHETKRALPVLRAGLKFLKEREDVMLLFVGKLDSTLAPEFNKTLNDSGLQDRVKVTGYIDLEDFCDYIDAVDVCFNLRHPYNGESSAALARMLSRGKCVVVNDVGSFGETPDDCCVKLPPVEEMSDKKEERLIYQTMKQLVDDVALRETIGQNARKYAEDVLDVKKIAKQYAEFIQSDRRCLLDEALLDRIRRELVQPKAHSDAELRGIARTLAYCV